MVDPNSHLVPAIGNPKGTFTLEYLRVLTPPLVGIAEPSGTCTVRVVFVEKVGVAAIMPYSKIPVAPWANGVSDLL